MMILMMHIKSLYCARHSTKHFTCIKPHFIITEVRYYYPHFKDKDRQGTIKTTCLRTPSPIAPGEGSPTETRNGTSHWDGWVTLHPCVREDSSVSTGVPLSWYTLDLLKHTVPGIDHAPWKEGTRWGSRSAHRAPVQLPTTGHAASSGQRVRHAPPDRLCPKAAATVTAEGRATGVTLRAGSPSHAGSY